MENNTDKNNKSASQQEETIGSEVKKRRFWIRTDLILFAISVFLAVTAYILIAAISTENRSWQIFTRPSQENLIPDAKNHQAERLIDGILVNAGKENIRPLAIMIDNHSNAWPPSGLVKANLVFEAEAEGGITRYLALFAGPEDVEKIGPVRSARPYFVDWAREFSALYTHVGGSPEALVKIKKDNIYDINEFYNQYSFWRGAGFRAPHNVFTSSPLLRAYIEEHSRGEAKYFPWLYKPDTKLGLRPERQIINIAYRLKGYGVEWIYSPQTNSYTRYLGKVEHQDSSGTAITAKNIVIQVVPAKVIDEELRLKMNTIGSGKAILCRDGRCEEGTWQKKNASARTRYYDKAGIEFRFNRGTTWIEVIRDDIKFSIE